MFIKLLFFLKQTRTLMISTKRLIGLILLLLCCFYSCQNEPSAAKGTRVIDLPNAPEAVCRTWQLFLDKNEIAKAMLLGSPKTKNWLRDNQALFLADQEVEVTKFLSMTCSESADAAICKYTLREEGELIEDYFTLIQQQGQWLIHIEEVDSNDPKEQLFEKMKKALEL